MSAQELRKAAATLRELAGFATAGPWLGGERIVWTTAPPDHLDDAIVSDGPDGLGGVVETADAAYIATMHPGVGLALADWLDDEARAAGYHENRVIPSALTIARLINGGAA